MTRFLATPLVALAATGLFLALPAQSQASGISLSINIGRPAVVSPVVAPVVYAPRPPVAVVGSYYPPAPVCATGPVIASYPPPFGVSSALYAPVVVRPALSPVIVPPPHHHHQHYPYPYGR